MKSLKHKSIFSAIFAIVMVLSILSLPVYAETNHGGSGAGGETGKGSSDWKYTTRGRGIRIGIYFVEGKKEDFANPDAEVYQIGDPTDFAKAGIPSDYTVKRYTGKSVFDYMKKKEDYFALYADDEPYTYVHLTESVVKSMPEPFEATREQWHQWFEGNNYKNIPEITKLAERKYPVKISVKAYIENLLIIQYYMVHIKSSLSR